MNPSPERIKRLSTAHANLLSAHRYLAQPLPAGVPTDSLPLAEVESRLSEDQLRQCIDGLSALGRAEAPKAAFWKDLAKAAGALGEPAMSHQFEQEFFAALRGAKGTDR